MRISDWSSDVCSSDLTGPFYAADPGAAVEAADRCVANRRMQRSNAFAFGDFISFDERQKKQQQRKTLCAKGKPGCLLMQGFFERASCPREKRRTSMCGALRVCRIAGRWEENT